MSKTQVFIITAALAAAYGLGEAELGTAKAAVSIEQPANVHALLGASQIDVLETFANNTLCPTIDTNLKLSGTDVCSASSHAKRICFTWKRTAATPGDPDSDPPIPPTAATKTVSVGAAFGINGSWTPGVP